MISIARIGLIVLLLAHNAPMAKAAKATNNSLMLQPANTHPATPLKSKQGYLLLMIDVDGVSPSIEITPVSTQAKKSRRSLFKPMVVDLSETPTGLYLVPLTKGTYRISKVNAPYYNLPYILETDDDPRWQFTIEAGALNYAGHLLLKKERSSESIFAKLLNRIAADKERIDAELSGLLVSMPLRSAASQRDDYLNDIVLK